MSETQFLCLCLSVEGGTSVRFRFDSRLEIVNDSLQCLTRPYTSQISEAFVLEFDQFGLGVSPAGHWRAPTLRAPFEFATTFERQHETSLRPCLNRARLVRRHRFLSINHAEASAIASARTPSTTLITVWSYRGPNRYIYNGPELLR